MTTLQQFYFDRDSLGTSPSNKVVIERHTLPLTTYKIITPNYGAFYTESIVVQAVNPITGARTLLTKNIDYKCVEILAKESAEIGKEICFVILINNSSTNIFDIDYQALGGSENTSIPDLTQAINSISVNRVAGNWDDIIGKPTEFPPSPHLHDSADLYGLEYITDLLDKIKAAVIISDDTIHHQFDTKILALSTAINTYNIAFNNNDMNAIVSMNDSAKNTLAIVEKNLIYAQAKYNVAQTFYNKVNALYLASH